MIVQPITDRERSNPGQRAIDVGAERNGYEIVPLEAAVLPSDRVVAMVRGQAGVHPNGRIQRDTGMIGDTP